MIRVRIFGRRDRSNETRSTRRLVKTQPDEERDILKSAIFDGRFYAEQCGVRFATVEEAIRHFLATPDAGDPHPLFSMRWYRQENPDVAASGLNPLIHFLRYGALEGRSPTRSFDTRWYLETYPDVAAARLNALSHYLGHGVREGRNPSPRFSTADYLAAHGDVARSGTNPLVHYVMFGEAEGRRLSDRPFRLDERYGMPEHTFLEWRDAAVARLRRTRPKTRLFRELVVVLPEDGGAGERKSPATEGWAQIRDKARSQTVEIEICKWRDLGAKKASAEGLFLFAQPGDRLDADALDALLVACASEGDLFVFDMFYRVGQDAFPILHPGANPQYIKSVDSVFSRFAMSGALLEQALAGRPADARGLLLAAVDRVEAETGFGGLRHVAAPILETPSLEAAIRDGRRRVVVGEEVDDEAVDGKAEAATAHGERVSVVICTRNNGVLVDQLLRHLTTSCVAVKEILVVSNQTSSLVATRTLERWGAHRKVSIIRYADAFNFSDQCNRAAARAKGDLLLFLNDDIIGLNAAWLDKLIDALSDTGVGAVGPRLLYPNESVQHAGMYLGFHGTAGHSLRHAKLPEEDYVFMGTGSRDVSCVTGAVLLMRRGTFEDLGGFDIQLKTAYQDVDLCLRIQGLGLRVLYVPAATLLHLESVTISDMLQSEKVLRQRLNERAYFRRLYADGRLDRDRFHHEAFDLNDESLRTLARP